MMRDKYCTYLDTDVEDIPKTKPDIHDRLKEITYNATLLRELRAIYFVSKLIDDGKLKEDNDLMFENF